MADANDVQAKPPRLWPSLLSAAVLASVIAYKWLTRGPEMLFDFRLFVFPIYAPLAFGIIWPALLALQTILLPSPLYAKLRRKWVALLLFVASALCWVPIVNFEMQASARRREEAVLAAESTRQQQADLAAARSRLAQGGIFAFTEPFQKMEFEVLESYISEYELTEEQLLRASEHYENPKIMKLLAQKTNCPATALEILFTHTKEHLRTIPEGLASSQLGPVLENIAQNPNTPVAMLVEMVNSDHYFERWVPLKNPKLPKSVKMAYLKKGCDFWWPPEIRAIGADADTPVDVLVCLSTKQSAAYAVARNPHTPTNVIETMAGSTDYWLKTAGQESLAKKRAEGK